MYRLILIFCVSYLFSQYSSSASYIFQWEYDVFTTNKIIYKYSLDWLNDRQKEYEINSLIINKDSLRISYLEEILINRYTTNQFITADYEVSISSRDQQLLFTVNNINIYLHSVMDNEDLKYYELMKIKNELNEDSKKLANYIIMKESNFLNKIK